MAEPTEGNQERRESVRLDETIKLLFEVSKELLVNTLNALFNENFNADSVEIDKTATEYPNNDLDIIRADLFIKITQIKPRHFHIEMETEPSHIIGVRMFEYDVAKAISNWCLEGKPTEPVLYMPKSLVIHIEGASNVPQDCHRVNIVLADGQTVTYTAPVMRYFEYDESRLIREKLYNLLPLQVFMLRDELDRMTAKGDENGRQTAILKARDLTERIARKVIQIYKDGKIGLHDVDKIMIALSELFGHLNRRYSVNEKLNAEVEAMTRTYYDENLVKQTKVEMAKKAISEKLSLELISKLTNLDIETIKDLLQEQDADEEPQ